MSNGVYALYYDESAEVGVVFQCTPVEEAITRVYHYVFESYDSWHEMQDCHERDLHTLQGIATTMIILEVLRYNSLL